MVSIVAGIGQKHASAGGVDAKAGDLITQFVVQNGPYYTREFKRLEDRSGYVFSFNWAAAICGPVWMGARRLWGLVGVFAIAELVGITQLARGLLGDPGAGEALRAAKLLERAQARQEQFEQALAEGANNAAALQKAADNLFAKAGEFQQAADAVAALSSRFVLFGVTILLVVKFIEGCVANSALERRYMRWRADRSIGAGLSGVGSVGCLALLSMIYFLTAYKASAAAVPSLLAEFPAAAGWHAAAANSLDYGFEVLTQAAGPIFFAVTVALESVLDTLEAALVETPWPVVAIVTLILSYRLAGPRVALFTAVALAYLGLFGFWEKSMVTVALLGTAAFICVLIGLPLGIWCGKKPKIYAAVRPILDFMQTMPAFVYLIPVIAFFGIGKPPGVVATMVFGMPPVVRLTALGIQGVSHSVKEAAVAFGASRSYLLFKVELPLAMPSIMTGINQTILMCLSMVVIASLIGAKGLGEDVLMSLQYAAEGQGMLAGLAILFCAMVLDRIVQGRNQRRGN